LYAFLVQKGYLEPTGQACCQEKSKWVDIMEAYQERVGDELDDLGKKIDKLRIFLSSRAEALSGAETALLSRQLVVMKEYAAILVERISRWR
jgi:hypothetical protein